jgi:hypothetical protein
MTAEESKKRFAKMQLELGVWQLVKIRCLNLGTSLNLN